MVILVCIHVFNDHHILTIVITRNEIRTSYKYNDFQFYFLACFFRCIEVAACAMGRGKTGSRDQIHVVVVASSRGKKSSVRKRSRDAQSCTTCLCGRRKVYRYIRLKSFPRVKICTLQVDAAISYRPTSPELTGIEDIIIHV